MLILVFFKEYVKVQRLNTFNSCLIHSLEGTDYKRKITYKNFVSWRFFVDQILINVVQNFKRTETFWSFYFSCSFLYIYTDAGVPYSYMDESKFNSTQSLTFDIRVVNWKSSWYSVIIISATITCFYRCLFVYDVWIIKKLKA